MGLSCRKLLPADAAAYRAIRLESLQNAPSAFASTYEEEHVKPKLAFELFIEEQGGDVFMAGAFAGDELVAICGFFRERMLKTRHRGDLVQMYVKPAYRGHGAGRLVLQKAIETAFALEGLEQLVLGAESTNSAAIGLYESTGFRQYGYMKNYCRYKGTYHDERLFILSREEWSKTT